MAEITVILPVLENSQSVECANFEATTLEATNTIVNAF